MLNPPLACPLFDLVGSSAVYTALSSINTTLSNIYGLLGNVKDGNTLRVTISSIPTEDAIVVTNNILHPALNVIFEI